ncbi:MAG TPA: MauE/DoxX family redox-associated membrane protein [Sedimentisphaerales bacterium]|nr:MauE/DoxX family redox-associated membrane protein [Sedimentisphaerales bacterium]
MLNAMIRLGLGCLFVWSSLPKIQLPHDFLGHVYAYRLVGPASGMFVAMVLPWIELMVGICLLGGVFVTGALLACMAMAFMFTVAISWALYHGFNISCGCFGSDAALVGYGTLARSILIFLAGAFVFVVELFARPSIPILPSWCPRWSGLRRTSPAKTEHVTDRAAPREEDRLESQLL